MTLNMMIPGQVEKWVVLVNINQFSLKNLPITLFKECARELGTNYIDFGARTMVVNLTWFQNLAAKML